MPRNTAVVLIGLVLLLSTGISPRPQVSPLDEVVKTLGELNNRVLDLAALTDEQENSVGKGVVDLIKKEKSFTDRGRFNSSQIFRNILSNASRKHLAYELFIVQDKDFNAFAVAGGKTFLLTGLLDDLKSEDQVAFVIGHEVAHNELRHCVRKVTAGARASSIHPLLGNIVQIAYNVYSLPFSIEDEYQADEKGLRLMEAAGYSQTGAVQFFEKLKTIEAKYQREKRPALNDFISSHPTAEKRLAKIKNLR